MIYSKNCILFLIISFLLLVAVIGMGRKPPKMQKYPDFSTPEKTIKTVYIALKKKDNDILKNSFVTENVSYGSENFKSYEIIKKRIVTKDNINGFEKKDDVVIITKHLYSDRPPLKIYNLLRQYNGIWKVVFSIYIPDKNYPPEDQPDY